MELYVQKRQVFKLKYHLYNSSESRHQLDVNVIRRKKKMPIEFIP